MFCLGYKPLTVLLVLQADPVMVLNDDNTIVITSNRLAETGAPSLEQGLGKRCRGVKKVLQPKGMKVLPL